MTSDHAYLEAALPGFSRARELVKAAGDSVAPLGFIGTKFDSYRFANRLGWRSVSKGCDWMVSPAKRPPHLPENRPPPASDV